MSHREHIITNLNNSNGIPPLPQIAQQILTLSQDPDASIFSLSLLIEKDPSFSLQVLKLINSSFYGIARKVNNIKEAVPLLGIAEIRNIALMNSIFKVFPKGANAEFERLFQKSLCTAVASDLIAEKCGFKNRDDVFLAGLLQNIGIILLLNILPKAYCQILNIAAEKNIALSVVEHKILGLTNIEAGKIICEKWGVPDYIFYCIATRENGDLISEYEVDPKFHNLVKATHFGAIATDIFFEPHKETRIALFKKRLESKNMLDESVAEDILKTIPDVLKEAGGEFLLNIDPDLNYENLLAEAP